jgi:hypothetical protein
VIHLTATEKNNLVAWLKHTFSHVAQLLQTEPREKNIHMTRLTTELKSLKDILQSHLDHPTKSHPLTKEEMLILDQVREKTKTANRNNLTRTKAYETFYQQYPEVHWAYLAHMVSRNGGWNMTDLKGEMLPRLLSKQEIEDFFELLERCNWLIFQDAFTQLLLYAESKKRQQPLFHLLSHVNVSIFMKVLWQWFWKYGDSKIISLALIINEQNYIESRVIKNPKYKKNALGQAEFKTQSFLHLNHVLFPYWDSKTKKVRLAGTIVEDFNDLKTRIKVGRHLYALLFEVKEVAEGVRDWSNHMSHSGSRADYWPHIFTKTRNTISHHAYSLHLEGNKLHSKTPPIWSPVLEDAWQDVRNQEPAENHEWCHDDKAIGDLEKKEKPFPYDMTDEYYFALNKIELAIVAKEKLINS